MKKLIKVDWRSNEKILATSPRFTAWLIFACATFGFMAGVGMVMPGGLKNVLTWAFATIIVLVLLARQLDTVAKAQTPPGLKDWKPKCEHELTLHYKTGKYEVPHHKLIDMHRKCEDYAREDPNFSCAPECPAMKT